jgi:PAS domain S-box-containing protein
MSNPNNKLHTFLANSFPEKYIVLISIYIILAISILDLAGWAFGITVLKSIDDHWVPMMIDTAISFVLCALSLYIIQKKITTGFISLIPKISGVLVFMAGALSSYLQIAILNNANEKTMMENPFLGIFLAPNNRMALVTACSFVLIGIIIFLISFHKKRLTEIAHAIISPVLLISYMIPVSYILGLHQLHSINNVSVALPTGIAFCALCLGILFNGTSSWVMKVFTSRSSGGLMARRLLPGLILLPVVIAWFRIQGEERGIFESEVGVGLVAITYTVCFVFLTWVSAKGANKIDKKRELAEKILRESEKRRLAILDTAMDGFWLVNKQGDLLDVNETYCRMSGFSRHELQLMNVSELETVETKEVNEAHILKVISEGEDRFETRLRRKDGSSFDVAVSIQYQEDEGGQFVAFLHDITERKKAEEAIIESENRYRSLFEEGNDAIFLVDLTSGRYADCNRMAEKLTGYTRDEIVEMKTGSLVTTPHKDELESNLEIIMSGRVLRSETEISSKDGKLIPVEFNSSLVTINKKPCILSMFHDISERRVVEEKLRQSEEKVRFKLQSILSPEGSLADLELNDIIDAPSIQKLMDNFYELAQIPMAIIDIKGKVLVGVGWQDICTKFHRVHPESCRNCIESDVQLTQSIPDGEYKLYKCKNNMWDIATPLVIGGEHKGNLFMGQFFFESEPIDYMFFKKQANHYNFDEQEYLEALERVPRISKQKLNHAKEFFLNLSRSISLLSYSNIKLARAITQQKKVDDALRESEGFLNKAQEIAHLGSWSLDLIKNQLTWSDEIYRIFGLQPNEFAATYEGFLEAVHPDDRDSVNSTYSNSILKGKDNYEIEHRIVRKHNGEIRYVYEKCEHVRDSTGKIVGSVGMVHDITESKLISDTQKFLLQRGFSDHDKDFFESVAKYLAQCLNMDYVCIDRLEGDGLTAQTVAIFNDGKFDTNVTYALKETPCGVVVGKSICFFSENVCSLFPNDSALQDLNAESYIGTTLWSFDGNPIGLIAVIGRKPLENQHLAETVLNIVAIRVAGELERTKSVKELQESNQRLELAQRSSGAGIWDWDMVNQQLSWSRELYQLFGLNPLIDHASFEIWEKMIHPDDREIARFRIDQAIKNKTALTSEYRIVHNDQERWIIALGDTVYNDTDSPIRMSGICIDITDRKSKEETLRKLNQTLLALSKSSQTMSQSVDETEYLKQVCKIVVDDTDFAMVWIGYAEDDEAKTIRPVASAGFSDDYLEKIKISWDDSELGRGPTGTAIKTGNISMCNNMLTDPDFKPWRELALKNGFASSAVFPLKTGDKTFGAISIYSNEPKSFLDVEINMLSELANDLAHGITTIRLRSAHQEAEKALSKSHSQLEVLVKERTHELQMTNDLLKKEINIRKQHEQHLKLAEEKYRTVADFTFGWEFWIDNNDVMLYCSPSCERITGHKAIEFIQNPQLLYSIIYPEDLNIFLDHKGKEQIAQNDRPEIQFRIIRSDGKVRWISHICQPVYDNSGNLIGSRGSNNDISSRKKMEEQLKTSNQKYQLLSANISDGIFICKNGNFEYVNKSLNLLFGYDDHELEGQKLMQLIIPDHRDEVEAFLSINYPSDQYRNIEIECRKKDQSNIFVELFLNYVAKQGVIYGVVHDITEKKQIQKNIVKAIIQTEENEKANFSKELHDGLGPLLSTIKLYLEWSERAKSDKSRQEIIKKAENILEEALSTVKEISNKLSPHLLTYYGLNSAIQSFIDKLEETSTFEIDFQSNLNRRLYMEVEAAIYRATIECINNSMKYANAKNIKIILDDTGDQLKLYYKDDGIGFDLENALLTKRGLGLFNLQNRIETIGGKINMSSKLGQGVDYQILIYL